MVNTYTKTKAIELGTSESYRNPTIDNEGSKTKPKSGLLRKVMIGGAALVTLIAATGCGEVKEVKNIPYQGYNSWYADEGQRNLVFDQEHKEAREGEPKLVIGGDDRSYELEIGTKYNVKYNDGFFGKSIESITPSK